MTKLVMVEELCTFRHRYVVELNDEDPAEWAMDDVVCKDPESFCEFSQYHVGDQILSHRVISEEEYLRMFDEDNDYLADWPIEKKMGFINKSTEDKTSTSALNNSQVNNSLSDSTN